MLLMLLRLFVYVSVKSYQIKSFESCQLFIHDIHDVSISSDDNRVTLSTKFTFQNKNKHKKVQNCVENRNSIALVENQIHLQLFLFYKEWSTHKYRGLNDRP